MALRRSWPGANPAREGCRDSRFSDLAKIATEVLDQFELEPIIAFTLLSGRLLPGTIGMTYDRQSEGADRLAMDCYKKLSTQLLESGYPAYRLGQLAKP